MNTNELTVALVGVGGRGKWAVSHFHSAPGWRVVALVDSSPACLDAAAKATLLPGEACYGDLQTALAETRPDAVVICTPTAAHAPLCRIAFRGGCHVLVEKAMSNDWEECKALVREAEEAGVKFCVSQNYRYNPHTQTLRSVLNDPENPACPGRVEMIDFIHHRYRPEPRTQNYPHAMIWDMSCHHLDLMMALVGESPVRVRSEVFSTPWSRYGYPANVQAWFEYEDGRRMRYVLSHSASISHLHLLLMGERGAVALDTNKGVWHYPMPAEQFGSVDPVPVPIAEGISANGTREVVSAWRDYIELGVEPPISGRQNLQTLRMCQMLMRSADLGRPVSVEEFAL